MPYKHPSVSIIIPCHNSAKYISEAVESVFNQSYPDWELILIDDASTDETVKIIKKYVNKDQRIVAHYLGCNMGPAVARNIAIKMALGRYIAFLDSDDVWHPEKLQKQLDFMSSARASFSYTAYEKIDESGRHQGRIIKVKPTVTYRQLLSNTTIACLTAIYDTTLLGKVYMPEISKRQDLALWLKILKTGVVGYGLNEPLAYLRKRKNSVSSNKLIAAIYVWKVYRDIEKLTLFASTYHFVMYAVHAFLKARI